jgi:hypothetical protein
LICSWTVVGVQGTAQHSLGDAKSGRVVTDEGFVMRVYDISTAMDVFGGYDAPRMWGASIKYKFQCSLGD